MNGFQIGLCDPRKSASNLQRITEQAPRRDVPRYRQIRISFHSENAITNGESGGRRKLEKARHTAFVPIIAPENNARRDIEIRQMDFSSIRKLQGQSKKV